MYDDEEKGSDELLTEYDPNALEGMENDVDRAEKAGLAEDKLIQHVDPLDDDDEDDEIPDIDPPDDQAHPQYDPLPPAE